MKKLNQFLAESGNVLPNQARPYESKHAGKYIM